MEVRPALPKIFVPPCYIQQPNILSHWRYESRREAQQLLPHLWLGPIGVAKESLLNSHGIKVLIGISDMKCKLRHSPEYEFHAFRPEDIQVGGVMPVSHFDRVNQIIDNAFQRELSVMLFCDSGNDLSATAAAAYIMHHFDYNYIEGIQYVQSKRFSICLDDTQKYSLQTYQGIRDAQRASLNGLPNSADKRQIEDADLMQVNGSSQNGVKKRMHDDGSDDGDVDMEL